MWAERGRQSFTIGVHIFLQPRDACFFAIRPVEVCAAKAAGRLGASGAPAFAAAAHDAMDLTREFGSREARALLYPVQPPRQKIHPRKKSAVPPDADMTRD